MKIERQAMIRKLISEKQLETQEELAEELRRLGFKVTQATVSRDIREMNIVKTTDGNGAYCYTVSDVVEPEQVSDRLRRIFIDSVLSVACANNIIVLHTLAGSASAAAEVIDNMSLPQILGTMAGDNTILVIVRSNDEAPMIADRFREMIK